MREMKVFMVCEGTDPVKVSGPPEALDIAREILTGLDREAFYVLPLSARNEIIGKHMVSMGSVSGSVVHPREVFKICVLANASGVILLHNHPSGDPTPSQEDLQITKQLVATGKILGIPVIDHLIIADDRHMSFADEHML